MRATRNTVQRETVLGVVKGMHNHPTAEEVFAEVHSIDEKISLATVYRNLTVLSEQGKIRKVPMPGTAPARYDFNLMPHYHAVCSECGRVVDAFPSSGMPEMSFHEGFTPESVEVVVTGKCEHCAKKR